MDSIQIGEQKLSLVKDPFNKTNITLVRVSYRKSHFDDSWMAIGKVEFENGNTKGGQEFESDTFDNCTKQIKEFIDSLNKK